MLNHFRLRLCLRSVLSFHEAKVRDYYCFRGGLKTRHIVQEAENEATILSIVSCRLGVAFVSEATRWRCPGGLVLLPVMDLNLPLLFALVWRKDNASPLLAKFVGDVRLLPGVKAFMKG